MTGYERLTDALAAHGVTIRAGRTEQTVKCPAHEDKTASLSISQGQKGALAHCHAGCSADAVLAAVGLTAADLFDEPPTSRRQIVATYDYTDEGRGLLRQVVRFPDRVFMQRRPDGNGGWIWKTTGVRRVLYGLPEIIAAVTAGDQIVVVEGEKDADRLRREGIVATTNPMGAKAKWSDCESDVLDGADVVVIPDNDVVGQEHAEEVANDLASRATVRVLELPDLPPGGDVSDWFDNGGTADELRALVAATPEWTPGPIEYDPATAPSVAEALAALYVFFGRFLHFESAEQLVAFVLWAAATHVFDAYDVIAYLWLNSPVKRAGKTLALDLLELVVREPVATNDLSPAALYRIVEDRHPTLLIDEVDTVFPSSRGGDPTREELRGLLNAGYRKGRKALRVGGPRRDTVEEFDVFSPKALAGIGKLPDTIADRCIPIALQRKPKTVAKERFRSRKVQPEGAAVFEIVAHALAGKSAEISRMDPDLPEELNDREQDTWELLFAVADIAGGDWPGLARTAAIRLSMDSQDATDTRGERLLADLREVWGDDEPAIPTKVLIERLVALEEAEWGDLYGRPIAARFLAKTLKPYGVTSRTVKWQGSTPKGYRREHLDPVWDRYLSATSATWATSHTGQDVPPGNPKATERQPDETDSRGGGEVAQRLPTETPYRAAEVAPVAQVALGVRERVTDAEATNATKRAFLTRSGVTKEDARALWAAACEDLGLPGDEPLTLDELAEIRRALDFEEAV